MKRLLQVLALTAIGTLAYAAEVQGILLDKACSPKIVQSNDQAAAKKHTRDCALMDECVKAGYGVLTPDGKFINIDPAGSAKVVEALKASKKDSDIRVKVTGELKGEVIKLTAIKIQ
jgi:hypothetical protein